MSTQTICVNSTPGDATAAAKVVAENLRATGKVVTIGNEYTQQYGHKAGMLAVDLTIDDAPVAPSIAEPPQIPQTEAVPFDEGPDLSQGPDAVDDDGNFTPASRIAKPKRK